MKRYKKVIDILYNIMYWIINENHNMLTKYSCPFSIHKLQGRRLVVDLD